MTLPQQELIDGQPYTTSPIPAAYYESPFPQGPPSGYSYQTRPVSREDAVTLSQTADDIDSHSMRCPQPEFLRPGMATGSPGSNKAVAHAGTNRTAPAGAEQWSSHPGPPMTDRGIPPSSFPSVNPDPDTQSAPKALRVTNFSLDSVYDNPPESSGRTDLPTAPAPTLRATSRPMAREVLVRNALRVNKEIAPVNEEVIISEGPTTKTSRPVTSTSSAAFRDSWTASIWSSPSLSDTIPTNGTNSMRGDIGWTDSRVLSLLDRVPKRNWEGRI